MYFETFETLRLWEFETLRLLRLWEFETLRLWNFETLRLWEFESLRLWEFESLRVWDFETFETFETLRLWNFESLRLWEFETLRLLRLWEFDFFLVRLFVRTLVFLHFNVFLYTGVNTGTCTFLPKWSLINCTNKTQSCNKKYNQCTKHKSTNLSILQSTKGTRRINSN